MWGRLLQRLETFGAWSLILVAVVFAVDVVARYAFGLTAAFFPDLEWYITCLAVSCGLAAALRAESHARVELISERLPRSTQSLITRLGHLVLLLPWCLFVLYAGGRYALNSFAIGEGSSDPGGLPWRWLPKMLMVLGFALLGVEGAFRLFLSRTPNHSTASNDN